MSNTGTIYMDLHIHTTASDGQYTPAEIVAMAKQKGLSMISITDHDTVSGIAEGRTMADKAGIRFVSGIEISTELHEEIHVLGYGVDENSDILRQKCAQYERDRLDRGARICAYFERRNIPVDLEEVKTLAGSGSLGRPHFAQYLLEHGYVSSRQQAFNQYLTTREFHAETDRKKPTPQEAIELIHAAGGKAVLAHPGLMKLTESRQEQLITDLKQAGLDGLEAFYSKYSHHQENYYVKMAKRFDLAISCGSDYHGDKVKPETMLGMKFPEMYENRLVTEFLQ